MEGNNRCRNRRGCHSQMSGGVYEQVPQVVNNSKPWSIVSGLYSFMIMACLLGIIYMMLDYHCTTYSTNVNLSNITRNLADIEENLVKMKTSYFELENRITKFSQELPKIEGQVEVLETLANTLEYSPFGWDPKSKTCLPNVDVYLNHCSGDNRSNHSKQCLNKCSRHIKFNQMV